MSFVNDGSNWLKQHLSPEWGWMSFSVIAVFGILWNITHVVTTFMSPSTTSIEQPIAKPMNEANLEASLKAPLFGEYIPDLKHAEVADSSLNYVIVGIMYSTDPHQSQAVIQAEDGFSKIYKQGDFLSSNLEIKEIQPNGVIISNQGRFERLSLPKNDLQFDPAPPPLKMMKE